MCDHVIALCLGRSNVAPGRQPGQFGEAEPFVIPSAPGPGQSGVPWVVLCWLPGGLMCACPVPDLSAQNVRMWIAATLDTGVDRLSGHALLLCDLREPGSLSVWDESEPLPADFFVPSRSPGSHCRRGIARNPTLQLRRLTPAWRLSALAMLTSDAGGALTYLDSEATLESARLGDLPLTPSAWAEVAGLALLLGSGK